MFSIFFSIWVFFYEHSRITGLQGKGEGISLTPHYHFHLLHRHLDISRAITLESSPLHIASNRDISRHILTYSEYCVTLAHWEPCHIQNFIFVYLSVFRNIQTYSIIIAVVPRCISVPLNRYGCPKSEPKSFRTRFVKRP